MTLQRFASPADVTSSLISATSRISAGKPSVHELAFSGVAYLGQLLWYALLLILVGLMIVVAGFRRKAKQNGPPPRSGSD